jgi:hypothetical protein
MSRRTIAGIAALIIGVFLLGFPRAVHYWSVKKAEHLMQRELPEFSILHSPFSSTAEEVNLAVPFTPQAPHANWELPYQEACEEAAALMAIRYVFGNKIISADDADAGILDLVRTNEVILGYPVDQTAMQVMELIEEIDPIMNTRLLLDPTINELKSELSSANVIIVPAAGRKLRNPFYTQPGPLYHMLVLRGFTKDGYFITNDPGTRKGEGYLYPFERIMNAMGDWNDGDPASGEKIVVVLEPVAGAL